MVIRRVTCFIFLLSIFSTGLFSQDTFIKVPKENVYTDSIYADSIRMAFILSHRPLTSEQLNLFKGSIRPSVYGRVVTSFIDRSLYFKGAKGISVRSLTLKYRQADEWIFYSFAFLFLFLGAVLTISPEYVKVVFGLLLRQGSLQDKSRETKLNISLPSFMMNLLFIMAASFFIFFVLSKHYNQRTLNPLGFIFSCGTLISIFFVFKFLFLQLCGWLFRKKAVFDSYFTYLSLVNKGLGLLFLISSTLMAFGNVGLEGIVFAVSLCILIGLLVIRIVNSYFIFSQPLKIGVPEFLIGFLSLEMLPTLVVLKFLKENSDVLLNGFL
jgi:hypothetical protein